MAKMQYIGTGRRKSAIARVRLIPGTGKITINKKDLDDYLPMEVIDSFTDAAITLTEYVTIEKGIPLLFNGVDSQ